MPSQRGSWRTTPLPPDWATLRLRVLRRDGYRCTWTEHGQRCIAGATEVDHIGQPDDHSLHHLRSLCGPHHAERTKAQRREALARMPKMKRPSERHPGLR